MDKSIAFFDIETTGLSISEDRIIEICIIKLNLDGSKEKFYSLVDPGNVKISEEAYKKHNISMEQLIDKPTFMDISEDVIKFISGCDLGGYNLVRFDLPMLMEELNRNGKIFNYRQCKLIDPLLIYNKLEPRDLESAYTRYTGKKMLNAHAAEFDIEATIEIFEKQKELYDLPNSTEEIEKITIEDRSDWIDLSGKYKYDENKNVIFTFGKFKDKLVKDICAIDPGYIKWIIHNNTFSKETRIITEKMYNKYKK